jgi:hypothetical protein
MELANNPDPYDRYENVTLTMAVLGAPDQVGNSIGRDGEIIVDMGPAGTVVDLPGDDVRIYESNEDAEVEGYSLYGGSTYLGPWTLFGAGTGTASFDLSGCGLVQARYLRVVDDGDGSYNGAYPGFELDAIEWLGGGTTGLAQQEPPASPAARLRLTSVAPNPVGAGESLRLTYTVPSSAPATLRLYDVGGRLVTTLARDATTTTPERSLRWSARDAAGQPLPAGVYMLRLTTGEAWAARKILVVR